MIAFIDDHREAYWVEPIWFRRSPVDLSRACRRAARSVATVGPGEVTRF